MWRLSACHQLILLISVQLVNADCMTDLSGGGDHDFDMSAFVQTQTRVHLSASAGNVFPTLFPTHPPPHKNTTTLILPPFSKLSVEGFKKTQVSVGKSTTVSITINEYAVDRIDAKVEKDTLYLGVGYGYPFDAGAEASITVAKPLQGVEGPGVGELLIDTLNGPVSAFGSGKVEIDTLNGPVSVVSGAHVTVKELYAPSSDVRLDVTQGSWLQVDGLNVDSAHIRVIEGAHMKVKSGASRSCAVLQSGGSWTDLGSLKTPYASISAKGSSHFMGMIAEELNVAIESGARIQADVLGHVSGSCDSALLELDGGASASTTSVTVSNGGDIRFGPHKR